MKKLLQKVIIGIVAILLVAMFGCAALMDLATPCYIDEDLIAYAEEEPTSFLPFTTLWDAERIDNKFDYVHLVTQIDLQRQIEDDVVYYDYLKDKQNKYMTSAKEFQKAIFTPEGPIGLILPTLFGGTLGALLIPRPGDRKKS